MIPVVSDLFEHILTAPLWPIVCIVPVVNHEVDELYSKVNHKYIHNDPHNQSRNLPQCIDQHSKDVGDHDKYLFNNHCPELNCFSVFERLLPRRKVLVGCVNGSGW